MSLLSRLQGIYQFRLLGKAKINVMVMSNSALKSQEEGTFSHIFDLKGSIIKRTSLPKEAKAVRGQSFKEMCRGIVLKDQDLIGIQTFKNPDLINIDLRTRTRIL